MNTKATLSLLAAALAPLPLYAQEPAPAVQAAPSAASVRAKTLAPLALIPADAEAAAVLRIPHGIFENICIDSVAVGFSKGTGETAEGIYSMLALVVSKTMLDTVAPEWAAIAADQYGETIINASVEASAGLLQMLGTVAKETHLHPVYAVATPIPGKEAQFRDQVAKDLKKLQKAADKDDSVECVTINGMSGIKATITQGVQCPPEIESVEDGLLGRSIYILITERDGNAVYIVCENPDEINLPAKPELSVLGTEPWAAVDAHLADDIILAGAVAPELSNGVSAGYRQVLSIFTPVAGVFEKLAQTDPANADKFLAAAHGVGTLSSQLAGLIPNISKPTFMQVWGTPGAYHAEVSCDAAGHSYQPGSLKHAGKSADEGTILYIEGTPLTCSRTVDTGTLADAGMAIFNGAVATFKPEVSAYIQQQVSEAANYLPELTQALGGLQQMGSGLGGNAAIVVDNKTADFPHCRISFYSGVTDRSKVAGGWDQTMLAFNTIATKANRYPTDLRRMVISRQDGDITHHMFPMIFFSEPDAGLHASISDTALAFGTSVNLNKELVGSGDSGQDFAGTTFTFKVKPFVQAIRNANHGELHDPALLILEAVLESVSGSSTIKDGIHTLHIDVKMN